MGKRLSDKYIARRGKIWQEDPLEFFKDVIPKFKPTEQQAEFITAIAKPNAWVSVKSGHGVGKTSSLACLALWFLCCFDDAKVPITSPSKEQLKSTLWGELRKWHSNMSFPMRDWIDITAEKVTLIGEENTFAIARTARKENPDALQGFHAEHVLFLIDEASGVDSKIFEIAMGALTTADARFLLTGNPTQNTGFFFNSFREPKKGETKKWINFTLSSLESPNVKPGYADNIASEFGVESNEYRVRVLGEFPDEGNMQFISRLLVDNAVNRWVEIVKNPELYNFQPKILGVDVARFGDDKSCLVLRQGLYCKVLHVIPKNTVTELARLVARLHKEHKFMSICIDAGGVGGGVYDWLEERGYPVVSVEFGSRAENTEWYKNCRTEIWARGKEWLERGGLDPNEVLIEDLAAPEYSFTPQTQIILESKEKIKSRLKRSPDIADAWALTFADSSAFEDDPDDDGDGVFLGSNVITCDDVDLYDYDAA